MAQVSNPNERTLEASNLIITSYIDEDNSIKVTFVMNGDHTVYVENHGGFHNGDVLTLENPEEIYLDIQSLDTILQVQVGQTVIFVNSNDYYEGFQIDADTTITVIFMA